MHAMRRLLCLGCLLASAAAAAGEGWHEPARGSAERSQVMAALRAHMRAFETGPLVFVVRELCLGRAGGWISADPRSPDGRSRYETLNAALERRDGVWRVRQLACGEEACPPGTDAQALRAQAAPGCR